MLDTRLLKSKKAYLDLSYEQLEKETEIPIRRLKYILNKKCKRVEYSELTRICNALGVTIDEVVES